MFFATEYLTSRLVSNVIYKPVQAHCRLQFGLGRCRQKFENNTFTLLILNIFQPRGKFINNLPHKTPFIHSRREQDPLNLGNRTTGQRMCGQTVLWWVITFITKEKNEVPISSLTWPTTDAWTKALSLFQS